MALKLATQVLQKVKRVALPSSTDKPAHPQGQARYRRDQKLRRAGASQQDLDDLNGVSKYGRRCDDY